MTKLQTTNYKLLTPQKGFTLIESVVATALFAFVIVSILGVYVSGIQLDRKSRSQRAVTQNSRFIMEFLAKEIRNGSINYASYPGGTVSGTVDLYIEDPSKQIEHFYLSGTNLILNKAGADTNLNSSGVKVTNLQFYILPLTDPYLSIGTANEQPHVTITLGLTSNYGSQATEVAKLDLQSTFAIRAYPSRLVGGGQLPPPAPVITYSGAGSGSKDLSTGPLTLLVAGAYNISTNIDSNVTVQCWAGGGGGGALSQNQGGGIYQNGGGGGGGGFASVVISIDAGPGSSLVVGAGGIRGEWVENDEARTFNGGNGGNSSFGTIVASGGIGGLKGQSGGTGGAGGGFSGGSNGFVGGGGGAGIVWDGFSGGGGGGGGGAGSAANGGNGGNGTYSSTYGYAGGAGGAGGSPDGGTGGNGQYGATDAIAPGGGGGGGNPASGGAVHGLVGANGKCIISYP